MAENEKVVYVVGAISNDPKYKEKFQKAKNNLLRSGYKRVIIPTCTPDNLPYERYAPISIGFVQACDIVFALPDWEVSVGARAEVAYARMCGKDIIFEGTL